MEIRSLEPSHRELSNEYKYKVIGPIEAEIIREE